MCGISFYCSQKESLSEQLKNSLDVSSHRGPDAQGIEERVVGNFNIGLGHNRLSIVDLSETGAQPMLGDDGIVLTYNGEVYNHNVLRLELKKKGYEFKGSSDTEVILKAYQEYGEKSFGMLKGMFSFIILDEMKKVVFIVRDTVGVKPIYLFRDEQQVIASSEIKGLKEFSSVSFELDKDDIYEFFNNGFLYEPSTGFKKVKKLPPGYMLKMDLEKNDVNISRYKDLSSFLSSEQPFKKIRKAIDDQRFSDVPLGVFFSGGADSSILAKYSENKELFFAKYDKDPAADLDLKYSKLIADYLDKELVVAELSSADDVESLLQSIDFVARNTEELVSDYTFWATYKLSLSARKQGYKVMLSGMGGDEVFAGYPRYLVLKRHRLIKFLSPLLKCALHLKLFPKKLNKKFERLVSYSSEKEWGVAYSRMLGYFNRKELEDLFGKEKDIEFSKRINNVLASYDGDFNDKVKVAQHMDLTGFLSHNLVVSDKASMLASIELRVPLLDEALVAHGLSISSDELIYRNQTKYPLKQLLSNILPKSLFDRPKTGFNPPLDDLINKIGKERIALELSNLKVYLNFIVIEELLDKHFSGASNNTYKLWQLLYFSRWLGNNEALH
jgi:asparagine synthase (glutamine-hydrolysing)